MEWIEAAINTKPNELNALCSRLEALGVDSYVIEDEDTYKTFLEENRKFWDYVDEDLFDSWQGLCRVKFYFAADEDGRRSLSQLRACLGGTEILTALVADEDWENNWKQYYRPIEIGEGLLIVPQWEETPETNGRTVLLLDPGLAFGTGSHPTTSMCLEAMQDIDLKGQQVLDLGCGSGILGIAAVLLGADCSTGCDIDPKSPEIAVQNAALNGIGTDRFKVFCGDVLDERGLGGRLTPKGYKLVLANIVADVIIALAPAAKRFVAEDGHFICSGIIDGREAEVIAALNAAGFAVERHCRKENWSAFICR